MTARMLAITILAAGRLNIMGILTESPFLHIAPVCQFEHAGAFTALYLEHFDGYKFFLALRNLN